MKKNLLIVALLLCGALTTFAQNADAVMKRYLKETNMSTLEGEHSWMLDMVSTVNQGGANMVMPTIVIQENPGNKMKIDMEAMGQKMLIVINGKQGWMQVAGQVSPIPEAQLTQMAGQGDFLSNIKWDNAKYNFTYEGEKDGFETLTITPKNETPGASEMKAKFDKKTGLLNSIDIKVQGMDMTMTMSDYKTFGTVKIPTMMKTEMNGQVVSSTVINKFEIDYPTTEFMFVEPK